MALALRDGTFGYSVETSGLDEHLATAMGVMNAACAEVVSTIATALETGEWEGHAIRSPEHWVAWHCGVSPARARRLVAMARALEHLPAASAAFAEGALTEDQAGVVCRHADPAHDAEVTELARRCTVSQLRRVLPSLGGAGTVSEADTTEVGEDGDPGPSNADIPGRREVAFGNLDDGRWWCRLVLPPDEGALVQKAFEASRSALFCARRGQDGGDDRAPFEVSWSDALVHMAHVALANVEGTGRPPADRFQVIVHVDADAPGPARLHLGPALPPSLRRYVDCDATMRAVVERAGTPVSILARRRSVDDRMRALIEQRDQGCRVPGCAQRRWLHIHHLVHHEDGGRSVPENLCALCPFHHRMHHLGRLAIRGDPTGPDGLVFSDEAGRVLAGPRPRPPGRPPPEAAREMGLPEVRWNPPIGEYLDSKWISWS